MRITTAAVLASAMMTGISGCSDGFDLPKPAQMEGVSGNGQRATAGNRLAVPLAVLVTASDGSPVPREQIRWTLSEGTGADLSDSVTVTDGTGLAQAYLTLGPAAGSYTVSAVVVRNPELVVAFFAEALAAPELEATIPAVFSSGDQVVLQGAFLTDSTVIEFDGIEADVVAVSPTARGITVVVPNCLVPGTVTITARVGISVSTEITATYVPSQDPLTLSPGEYMTVEPEALGSCATFPAAGGSGAEYLLAPQIVSETAGDTTWFRLLGNDAPVAVPVAMSHTIERPAAAFDDHLRGLEVELSQRPRRPLSEQEIHAAPILLDTKIGDRREFRVCDKVTCSQESDFAKVTAAVKYVGDHSLIYEDLEAPANGLRDTDFGELGALFDTDLHGVATQAFGSESDLDRNGRVNILFTPVVNGLTEISNCSESFVTGFFFPLDIDPTASRDERSNQAEVFYAVVPDPQGTVTCDHSVDRIMRIVPVTFIHEFQHMINFYQHVVVRAGHSEVTWLNESMSHMAEELAALHFESLGQNERFARFVLGDLYNGFKYLKDSGSHQLMYSQGTGTLEERGAGWLFLRWLTDQFGTGVLRRISESDLTGAANIVAAIGEPMSKMLPDWFLANYVSDHPDLEDVPERLRYKTWDLRAVYSSLNAQDQSLFDSEFPIEPPVFTGGAFEVSGTLGGGSGAYFTVVQGAGQDGFTVELVGSNGSPLPEDAAARLSVVRIR